MFLSGSPYYSFLQESYDKVGHKTWLNDDFLDSKLSISRNLFTKESLDLRKPNPKELEVYALLSGLPFSKKITDKLLAVQHDITEILRDSLHYWVLPSNFGVEYCVFKWPEERWDSSWFPLINEELSLLNKPPFRFSIHGIQVNPDGCIVAKGYDEGGMIFRIREHLKVNLEFFPKKQSGWAHIPIGRILEPLGEAKFSELEILINGLSDTFIVSDTINSIKFVHETRWYMEKKSTLSELILS